MKASSLLIMTLLVCIAVPAEAAMIDEDIAQLKTELLSLIKRVETLEAENQVLSAEAETMPKAKSSTSWTDSLNFKGDFGYRHERIDVEGHKVWERHRILARGLLTAKPADNLEVGIGFVSGTDDPRSAQQTLGEGGSTKDLRLDLGYFKWQAKPGVRLIGGKMKNTWHRAGDNGLLWDSNYRPEGLVLALKGDALFLSAGFNFLESDSRKSRSGLMYGIQAGVRRGTKIGKLKAGISYFDFNTKGKAVQYGRPDMFFGNSFVCANSGAACTYAYDYQELEVFAELNTRFGDLPATLFADYVRNLDAKKLDTGWASGVKIARPGWEFIYIYEDLEADAVLGHLVAKGLSGAETDVRGHGFIGGWMPNKQWKLSLKYFTSVRKMDKDKTQDFSRLQFNSLFRF